MPSVLRTAFKAVSILLSTSFGFSVVAVVVAVAAVLVVAATLVVFVVTPATEHNNDIDDAPHFDVAAPTFLGIFQTFVDFVNTVVIVETHCMTQ